MVYNIFHPPHIKLDCLFILRKNRKADGEINMVALNMLHIIFFYYLHNVRFFSSTCFKIKYIIKENIMNLP